MAKKNGLSDTKKLPIPKQSDLNGGQPAARRSAQFPQNQNGARQKSVQNNVRRTARSNNGNRQSTVKRSRQPQPQQNQQPVYPPPYAGIQRASWQNGQQPQQPIYQQPPVYAQPPEFRVEEEPAPPKKHKRKKRRRHSCLRRIITSILAFAFFIFALYSVIAILAIRKIRYVETGDRALTSSMAEEDSMVRNILLIGSDSRGDEQGRADSMILLSFSKHNHTMTITSLLRDSYASIPGYGTNKLNAAYAYGGPTLLMDTITNNFGIRIDDYVCINFKAFVNIADAVGGVKIKISDEEAQAINVILESEVNGLMGDDPKSDFLPSGGTFVLNGKQALSYARIRYIGNADYERTERQRTVLELLLQKLKTLSPDAIVNLIGKAMPELSTNMSGGALYLLSLQMPYELLSYDKQMLRLPANGTFSDQTAPDGQMVLAVDYDANLQIYKQAVTDPNGLDDAEETES